jgi:hypothetical protein
MRIIFLVFCVLIFQFGHAASITWTGAINSDWNTPGNWSPEQVPGASDDVFVNGYSGSLNNIYSFLSFNLSNSTISGISYSIYVYGDCSISNSTLNSGYISVLAGGHFNLLNTNTTNFLFNVTALSVNISESDLSGASFSTFTQTGNFDVIQSGGNTFSFASFHLAGSGNWIFGNTLPDIFNGDTGFYNYDDGQIRIAESSVGNEFNGSVFLDNNMGAAPGTRSIHVARESGATLEITGDVGLANNGSTGIFFGENGGVTTITSSTNFTFPYGSFVDGTLMFANVVCDRFMDIAWDILQNDAALVIGPNSVFNQGFQAYTPRLYLNGASFNQSCALIKTGNQTDLSLGGNTFNSPLITNYSDGNLVLGTVSPDIFNGSSSFYNRSNGQIRIAESSVGNEFNGSVFLDNNMGAAPGTRSIHVARESGATLEITGDVGLANNGSTGIFFGENGGVTTITSSTNFTFPYGSFVDGTLMFANVVCDRFMDIAWDILQNDAALVIGPNSVFNQGFQAYTPRLYLNGASFNQSCALIKTGNQTDLSLGGNTFNSPLITNYSDGNLVLGTVSPDIFNGSSSFYNRSNGQIRIAESSVGNEFNGSVFLDNNMGAAPGTRSIHVARESGATLEITGDVGLANNGSTGIFFGENGGVTTITSSTNFTFPYGSFVDGTLMFANVVCDRFMDIAWDILQNDAALVIGPNSVFNQGFQAYTPRLYLNGASFNQSCALIKTGNQTDLSLGGNTFNSPLITNYSDGNLVLGTVSPDIFNGSSSFYNRSNGQIRIAESSVGNEFNGSVFLDNNMGAAPGTRSIHVARESGATLEITGDVGLANNGSTGIFFGENGGVTTITSSTNFTFPYGSFVDGTLMFANVVCDRFMDIAWDILQNDAALVIGPNSVFNQGFQAYTPRLYLNGASFNQSCALIKTGNQTDLSLGGNTFNSPLITNYSDGNLVLGTVSPDIFNGSSSFYNRSNGQIRIAESSVGNEFNGSVFLDNNMGAAPGTRSIHVARESGASVTIYGPIWVDNNGSTGIFFGENGGTTVMEATSSLGSYWFLGGTLQLGNLTCEVEIPNLTLSDDANLILGPNSVFNGSFNLWAPHIFVNYSEFYGDICLVYKTGSGNDYMEGGNIMNCTGGFGFQNYGDGEMHIATVAPDEYHNFCQFICNDFPNSKIYLAESPGNYSDAQLVFAGSGSSIHICETPGSSLIQDGVTSFQGDFYNVYFGEGGTVTFNNGDISSPSFFIESRLSFENTTFAVNTNIQLTDVGATLVLGANTLAQGTLTTDTPSLLLNGLTANGTCNFTKTGTANDQSGGGNTYNAGVTITNETTGNLLLAGSSNDIYNGNLTLVTQSSGNIDVASGQHAVIGGNITYNGANSILSGSSNTGKVIFSGSNNQSISNLNSNIPRMNTIRMEKSGNDLTLNCPLNIGLEGEFITGRIFSTSSNYIQFLDNSTVDPSNISNNSFVHGPVRKVGDDFFGFPVGKGNVYKPCAVSNPALVTDVFTAEYFDANSNPLYPHSSRVSSLNNISTCDYWTVDRTNGSSNVEVWLSWSPPSCNGMTNLSEVVIARWDATLQEWQDHGQDNVNGDVNEGYMSTLGPVTTFSPFALASLTPNNPLPVELLSFDAILNDDLTVTISWSTASENNSDKFILERSADGLKFEVFGELDAAGFSNFPLDYLYIDERPFNGVSYYRLKQLDLDGQLNIGPTKNIFLESEISIFPNPIRSGNELFSRGNYDSFSISTISGKSVTSGVKINDLPINVSSGIYLITFYRDGDENKILKLVVE